MDQQEAREINEETLDAQAQTDDGNRKPSNPKDLAAQLERRIKMTHIPPEALVEMSLAMLEGGKYGFFNYVISQVSANTYLDAIWRHAFLKYAAGQSRDPKTRVHALGSVMACCAVIICAEKRGCLIDDRAPFFKDIAGLEEMYRETSQKLEDVYGPPKPAWTEKKIQTIVDAWKKQREQKMKDKLQPKEECHEKTTGQYVGINRKYVHDDSSGSESHGDD